MHDILKLKKQFKVFFRFVSLITAIKNSLLHKTTS
jgi:hypothetical protein